MIYRFGVQIRLGGKAKDSDKFKTLELEEKAFNEAIQSIWKMQNLVKIEGHINKLEVEDSKIVSIGNLNQQAANTALIGTLVGSTSLMSNAPIMALAAKGRDGKTFRGEINGIRVIGQFTGVKFENNTPLIMVINEEQVKYKRFSNRCSPWY